MTRLQRQWMKIWHFSCGFRIDSTWNIVIVMFNSVQFIHTAIVTVSRCRRLPINYSDFFFTVSYVFSFFFLSALKLRDAYFSSTFHHYHIVFSLSLWKSIVVCFAIKMSNFRCFSHVRSSFQILVFAGVLDRKTIEPFLVCTI